MGKDINQHVKGQIHTPASVIYANEGSHIHQLRSIVLIRTPDFGLYS